MEKQYEIVERQLIATTKFLEIFKQIVTDDGR